MKLAGFVRKPFSACEAAGVTPRFLNFHGKDPLGFVVSLNLHRRHLDDDQRRLVGAKIVTMTQGRPSETSQIAKISREQAAALVNVDVAGIDRARKVVKDGSPELVQAVESGHVSVSAAADVAELPQHDQAAEKVGVNPRYVSDAKKIKREAPHLLEKMRAGSLTVPAAMRQMKEDQRKVELERPVKIALEPGLHRGDLEQAGALQQFDVLVDVHLAKVPVLHPALEGAHVTAVEDVGHPRDGIIATCRAQARHLAHGGEFAPLVALAPARLAVDCEDCSRIITSQDAAYQPAHGILQLHQHRIRARVG